MAAPYSSSPSREQRTATANRSGPASLGGMATSHKILTLNKEWEDKRRLASDFLEGEDVSSSDSDSSDGDIVHTPKNASDNWGVKDANAFLPKIPNSTSLSASSSKRPGSAACARETPVPIPGTRVATSILSAPSNEGRQDSASRPTETPVPLPDFGRASALNNLSDASASSSSSQAAEPRSDRSARPPSLTEESVSKAEQVRAEPEHQDQKDETEAQACPDEAKVQARRDETKAQNRPVTKIIIRKDLRFATPNELLLRIKQRIKQNAAQSSPVPRPSQSANALEAIKSNESPTDDSFKNEEYQQNASVEDEEAKDASSPYQTFPKIYLETCDGRPYSKITHPNGSIEINRGVIFPTNYKLRSEPPHYICPVRDCQTLLKNILSLSGHFSAKHCYSRFNDNRDGTISQVGKYKNLNKLSPAVVVSQNRLPQDAPPPSEARPPAWSATPAKRKLDQENRGTPAALTRSSSGSPLVVSDIPPSVVVNTDPAQVSRYILSILKPGHTVPYRGDVRAMMNLPQQRPLPTAFIEFHRDTNISSTIYACAVAYIVGVEVEGPTTCRLPRSRLSEKCIALPSALSEHTKRIFCKLTTCVSCHYRSHITRQRNTCDWAIESSSEDADAEPDGDAEGETSQSQANQTRAVTVTREARLKRAAPAAEETRPRKSVKTLPQLGDEKDSITEMESWEMAPGRLTDESGNENVAYSGPFLMSAQPFQVLPDVGIQVINALPGSSTRWTAEEDKIRLCTVANGKVRVKTGDTEFVIGPNGGFYIRPGQTCLVENRTYSTATLHCVTLTN
ncbi:hypothetical protein XA68_10742 [Ophiocordyceps unilateralis]|uniref:Uncharacterized protein n=1 Tax=Ophiocordyceps unilateralis TaxID=268505 RepID=A0A2A9PGF4_OPHUN|nr:hypothetical protein XA68_10742 [Ophiocordyceps unilateralis]